YVAMRALGDPDAFPSADLGLLHATASSTSRDLEQRARAWRPWRAYAAMYLWRIASRRANGGAKLLSSPAHTETPRRGDRRERLSSTVWFAT
ncbi:MAG: hypothetical protein WA859_12535, partial [Candidatus Sulfotelmatobacter sp.]